MRSTDKAQYSQNGSQTPDVASVDLEEGLRFAGKADGERVSLDVPAEYGGGNGAQPLRLLLLALAGCTAMDVLSILRKKRREVSGLTIEARGFPRKERPRIYERIEVLYTVRGSRLDETAVGRAVELSRDRYCPVMAMVRQAATVETRYRIEETTPTRASTGERGE